MGSVVIRALFIVEDIFSDVHLENVSHFTDLCCTLYWKLSMLSGKCITFCWKVLQSVLNFEHIVVNLNCKAKFILWHLTMRGLIQLTTQCGCKFFKPVPNAKVIDYQGESAVIMNRKYPSYLKLLLYSKFIQSVQPLKNLCFCRLNYTVEGASPAPCVSSMRRRRWKMTGNCLSTHYQRALQSVHYLNQKWILL